MRVNVEADENSMFTVVQKPKTAQLLQEAGVDAIVIVDQVYTIFTDEFKDVAPEMVLTATRDIQHLYIDPISGEDLMSIVDDPLNAPMSSEWT